MTRKYKSKYNPAKVGDVFQTKTGECEIIAYNSYRNVEVKFLDKYQHVTRTWVDALRKGTVRNPFYPSLHGVGFIGSGKYKSTITGSKKKNKSYKVWADMITRCYDPKCHIKQPGYADCTVHEEWHNYQNFADWYYQQRREPGWQIDKDLRVLGNKQYSKDTCSIVPEEINTMLMDCKASRGDLPIGVSRDKKKYRARIKIDAVEHILGYFFTPEEAFQAYKIAKEENIKRVATKYKGVIDPVILNNLMTYEVCMDD